MSELAQVEVLSARFRAKRLDKGELLCSNHTRPLNTLRGVVGEQARIYRSMINGKISTIEGMRLIFCLREVRCSLEAAIAVETAAAERAKAEAKEAAPRATPTAMSVTIQTIPSGMHFTEVGRAKCEAGEPITSDDLVPHTSAPMLEHQPAAPVVHEQEQEQELEQEQQIKSQLTELSSLVEQVVHEKEREQAHQQSDGGVFYLPDRRAPPQVIPPKRPRFGP